MWIRGSQAPPRHPAPADVHNLLLSLLHPVRKTPTKSQFRQHLLHLARFLTPFHSASNRLRVRARARTRDKSSFHKDLRTAL